MALLTFGGESHGLMVRGRCLSKRGQVAAHAFGGESEAIELSDRSDFVAGITVDGRMYGTVRTPHHSCGDVDPRGNPGTFPGRC